MSAPVLARCAWFTRSAPDFRWVPSPADGGGPAVAECRASLGERYATIWLPQGARIRCRIPRGKDPFAVTLQHRYGRTGDELIEVTLVRPDA